MSTTLTQGASFVADRVFKSVTTVFDISDFVSEQNFNVNLRTSDNNIATQIMNGKETSEIFEELSSSVGGLHQLQFS